MMKFADSLYKCKMLKRAASRTPNPTKAGKLDPKIWEPSDLWGKPCVILLRFLGDEILPSHILGGGFMIYFHPYLGK